VGFTNSDDLRLHKTSHHHSQFVGTGNATGVAAAEVVEVETRKTALRMNGDGSVALLSAARDINMGELGGGVDRGYREGESRVRRTEGFEA
jgi:hypothetical protein